MKHYIILVVTTLLLETGTGLGQTKIDTNLAKAKNDILTSNEIYFKAFVYGDSALFIDRYAKDCCIMPPNTASMCGENAAPQFFNIGYHQLGIRNGRFITKEVYGNGSNYVTEEGLFELYDSQAKLIEHGKYLVLWKLTSEGWKMYRDSFNSNRPIKKHTK